MNSSTTSSTTSSVSTQTTDSHWSDSTSSTAAADVSDSQKTKDSLEKQKAVDHPVPIDEGIQVFSVMTLDVSPIATADTAITTTVHHQDEPLDDNEASILDAMTQITRAGSNEIMGYEAEPQPKEKRGTKVHCQEISIEPVAAESQTS